MLEGANLSSTVTGFQLLKTELRPQPSLVSFRDELCLPLDSYAEALSPSISE